jgi:hypothetical protein
VERQRAVNDGTATFTVNGITAREQLGAYEPLNRTHEFVVAAQQTNGRRNCRRSGMRLPEPERIGIERSADDGQAEWWVTIDDRRVVGFSGDDAQRRAERYASDLIQIAQAAPAAGERSPEPEPHDAATTAQREHADDRE